MGAGATSNGRAEIYYYDHIFNRALKRLQRTPDICEEHKASIIGMVKHLLAKGVSRGKSG